MIRAVRGSPRSQGFYSGLDPHHARADYGHTPYGYISRLRSKHITSALRTYHAPHGAYHDFEEVYMLRASAPLDAVALCALLRRWRSARGAICARALASKLADALRLIITEA